MRFKLSVAVRMFVILVVSCGLMSCGSRPGASKKGADVVAGDVHEPVTLTEVPPPSGSDTEKLGPLTGEAQVKADLSLEDVLEGMPRVVPENEGDSLTANESNDLVSEPPLVAQKFFAVGRQAFLQGDNFAAVQAFEKALRLAPQSPTWLRSLGQAWGRAGNRVAAAGHLRRAMAADSSDFESALTLGRLAADDRRFDEAVPAFAHALSRVEAMQKSPSPDVAVDPAAVPLLHFFLARVLAESGHARAADHSYGAYLEASRERTTGTAFSRDLAMVDAQRGETFVRRGDLAHQLDDPQAALDFYLSASKAGVMSQAGLRKRLLYTRLRLGQPEAARTLAMAAVTESHGDTAGLGLVRYAVEHGVPAAALSDELSALYASEGRPTALALAAADVLPPVNAALLLDDHLAHQPADTAVLKRRLELALNLEGQSDVSRLSTAAGLVVVAIGKSPDRDQTYADLLLAMIAENDVLHADSLVDVFEEPPFEAPRDAAADYLYGRALVSVGKTQEASVVFERISDAALPAAREAWAELLIDSGDYVKAESVLAPLADAHRPRADRLRVRALAESGRGDEALVLMETLLRDTAGGSDMPGLLRQKAKLLREHGDDVDAERVLLDVLNMTPTDETIYAELLDIYEDNPDMTQNLQRLWRRMIDTIPRARITRRQLVFLHLVNSDYVAAEKLLTPLLEEVPHDLELEGAAVQIYTGMGRNDALTTLVTAHLERCAASGELPDDQVMQPAMGYARHLNDLDRVLELSEAYWMPRPPSASRSLELARVRFTQERYDAAAEMSREGLDATYAPPVSDDEAAVMVSILSQSLLKLGDLEQAEAVVLAGMDRYPAHAAGLGRSLAAGLDEIEKPAEAEQFREMLVKRFPDDVELCNALGYGWASRGERLDEAKALIQRAIEAEPDSSAYLDSMGWVLYKQGLFEEALVFLERGHGLPGGDHPVIVDHVGDAYYRMGRVADAVRAWGSAGQGALAAAANPNNPSNQDPEMQGIGDRVAAKVKAVADHRDAPVADVGAGVVIPQLPEVVEPVREPVEDLAPAAAPLSGVDQPALPPVKADGPGVVVEDVE